MSNDFNLLACPLDGLPLTRQLNSAVCSSNHSYDFDRRGTINLLPVQFKKSLNPGDSKEMVQAREEFLNTGLYDAISDKLNQIVQANDAITIFDAGCGEGYYTQRLASHLENAVIAGMDISKDAIQSAAKRSRDIQWIVGTNANIPVTSHSVDCVLCLFGFPVWPEFARILKPGGIVVMVDPGPEHLIELRRVLYPEIKQKPEKETEIPEGFSSPVSERLQVTLPAMTGKTVSDLIAMTPHQHRATKEKREQAVKFSFDTMTLDVMFKIYRVKDLV